MTALEMVKVAGLPLSDRIKVAAAIITIDAQRDVRETLEDAAVLQKTAALEGINVSDDDAIQATVEARAEINMQKRAAYDEMTKEATLRDILSSPGFRIGGGAGLGAGLGMGGTALLDRDATAKELALAALLGGGGGAFLGTRPEELAKARQALIDLYSKAKGGIASAGKKIGEGIKQAQ